MEPDQQPDFRTLPPDWDEPPKFLGSWKRVYTAVVLYTIVLVITFYILTVTMNR